MQADLNFCWTRMCEGTFSDVAAHSVISVELALMTDIHQTNKHFQPEIINICGP